MASGGKRTRALIVGIDGGTWSILYPAMAGGYMPWLESLRSEGAHGVLDSTIPAITPAAWASFQTGQNPGRMGVFDFVRWDEARRRWAPVSSSDLTETVWEIAGRAGLKVGVLNVPLTYPVRRINGIMVAGIMAPSTRSAFIHPPELKKEFLRELPQYSIFRPVKLALEWTPVALADFVRDMAQSLELRVRAARWMMKKLPLDLCMVHFQSSDLIQHALWPDLDPTHPAHDPRCREAIMNGYYRRLDQAIAETAAAFGAPGPDAAVFIVSDHGFQSHYRQFNLGTWLMREGYIKARTSPNRPSRAVRLIQTLDVFGLRRKLVPERWREEAGILLRRAEGVHDWQDAAASAVRAGGKGNEGFIFILESARGRAGELGRELKGRLEALVDPENGSRVIEAVHAREDIFTGERLELMPDLVVEPGPGYSCNGHCEQSVEIFETIRPGEHFHAGRHHRRGIVMAGGRGIARGELGLADIWDVAPTLLYYLGIEAPPEMDGLVREDWFEPEFRASLSLRPAGPRPGAGGPGRTPDRAYGDDEEEQVKQRLKDLGYL